MKGTGLPPNRIVFSERFSCPVSRLHHRGNRAAALLVQRAAGRLPDLRRSWREAPVVRHRSWSCPIRSAEPSRRARSCHGPRAIRPHPYYMQVLGQSREGNSNSISTTPWEEFEQRTSSRHHPQRHQGPASHAHASRTGARSYDREKAVRRRRSAISTAACCRPKAPGCSEELAKFQTAAAVRDLPRQARLKPRRRWRSRLPGEDISISPPPRSVGDARAFFLEAPGAQLNEDAERQIAACRS